MTDKTQGSSVPASNGYGKRKIMAVMTPCVRACTTAGYGDKVCKGCGRTDREVLTWNRSPLRQKINIIERLDREGLLNDRNRPRYPWLG